MVAALTFSSPLSRLSISSGKWRFGDVGSYQVIYVISTSLSAPVSKANPAFNVSICIVGSGSEISLDIARSSSEATG